MACQLKSSWRCTICQAIFTCLPVLVGHIRASHSHCQHSFECGISDCKVVFRSTTTFYKHDIVRNSHAQLYTKTSKFHDDNVNNGSPSGDGSGGTTSEGYDPETELTSMPDCTPDAITLAAENLDSISPRSDIVEIATGYLLKLKQRPGVTESLLKEVVEMNQALIRGVIMNAIRDIQELESTDPAVLESKLEEHTSTLDCLSTSYSINSVMKQKYPTADPVKITLGTHIGNKTLDNVPDQIVYIPLINNLERILQNDHIRAQVDSGPHQLIYPKIGDLCDGELFKEHSILSINPNALQIVAYFDEVELANPLGTKTKKNKIGAVYFTIANIDPAQRSKLEAVHLVALFECGLLNHYTIDEILSPFYEDLERSFEVWLLLPCFMLLVAVFLVVVPLWQNPVPQLLAFGEILLGVPVFIVFVMDQPIRLKPRVFDSLRRFLTRSTNLALNTQTSKLIPQ